MFEVMMASRVFDNMTKFREEWGEMNFSILMM